MDLGLSHVSMMASTALAGLPVAAATAVGAGAEYSVAAAHNLSLAKAPVDAAARGLTGVSGMQVAAKVLGRTVAAVVIGSSALSGVRILSAGGPGALLHTSAGRAAVLGTVSGSLLLVPFPPAQIGAAALLALSAANELGALKVLDRSSQPAAGTMPQVRTLTQAMSTPRAAHI